MYGCKKIPVSACSGHRISRTEAQRPEQLASIKPAAIWPTTTLDAASDVMSRSKV